MIVQEILNKIKLRLGVIYTDPLKDQELTDRIESALDDMEMSGVKREQIESPLGIDTVERYLRGGQNDNIYISNITKLRLRGEINETNT